MRLARFLLMVVVASAWFVQPAAALYLNDNMIPGKPLPRTCSGWAHWGTDPNDVFRIYLLQGEQCDFYFGGPAGPDFDLYLYGPNADDFGGTVVDLSVSVGMSENIQYVATQEGWHYLEVHAFNGSGTYSMQYVKWWPSSPPQATPYRIWGSDRYNTAVQIARANFPGWRNVDHVIIASGEDRAAADPLAASGLVYAYGAPILLVRGTSVPASVIQALKDIRATNGPFTLHVVGGPVSVSPSVVSDITSQVSNVTVDRIAPYGSRYELAASIAYRMAQERPNEDWGGTFGNTALIANGEDPDKFFDALALSPVAASSGFPILLVKRDSIPSATANALSNLGLSWRRVAGGVNTISEEVFAQLDAGTPAAVRWSGHDRYETAAVIMRKSMSEYSPSLNDPYTVAVAAKLPDALTGGAFAGLRSGCILVTRPDAVPAPTSTFLHDFKAEVGKCAVLGGVNSVTDGAMVGIGIALSP